MKVLPAKSKEFKKPVAAIAFDRSSSDLPDNRDDYESLKLRLFIITLVLTGLIFLAITGFYGIGVALNYLLGACTGVVYLKMLAQSVDELGKQRSRLGYSRLGVFIGVIILATRLEYLQILPIFMGFLTYKAAILVFLVQDISSKPKALNG